MEDTPNAVAQRVKVIVCSGLALVHIYSRLFTDKPPIMEQTDQEARTIVPSISLWRFYFRELLNFSPQQLIGYVFVLLICIKHLFYDKATQPCELLTPSSCGSEKGTEEGSSKAQSSNHWQDSDREREASSNERCLQRQQVRPNVRHDKEVQTETETCTERGSPVESSPKFSSSSFSVKQGGTETLKDDEILALLRSKRLQPYKLEEEVGDLVRAVKIRRDLVSSELPNRNCLDLLPFSRYDYSFVTGTCCENVIGYLPVPVGVAGPLLLDGKKYQVPLATTEGCLVASINRGCRAICLSGGCTSQLVGDGMTRAPVVKFPSIKGSVQAKRWIDGSGGTLLKEAFDRTSRFARLQSVQAVVAGRQLFIRFKATTGDAMGMNMVCKGTESALSLLQHHFPDMQVVALSGNFCTDKKPAALNWIQGRGKSVVCEAIISGDVLRNVLKTTTTSIVELNTRKNLIGSAMAGTVGGYNAHAANAVTAIFLATGQDVAQNVVSSGCLTEMEPWSENPEYLYVACTMPCLEVGTVGGGTNLPPQKACLKMLGVDGSSAEKPGKNAEYLARIICATVLAGELSLLSALQAGHLVQSHLKHNRSKVEINPAELGAPVAFPAHPAPCSA